MTDPYYNEDRLKPLGKGFIGFDLKPGTSIEQAEEIAAYFNEYIDQITCTVF